MSCVTTIGQKRSDQIHSREVSAHHPFELLASQKNDTVRRFDECYLGAGKQSCVRSKLRRYNEATPVSHYSCMRPTHGLNVPPGQ